MILFKDIKDETILAMRAKNNPDEQARAIRKLNEDYQALAPKASWDEMRDMEEISWTGEEVQLPSDMLGIDLVWDDINAIQFIPRNRDAAEQIDSAFRYYTRSIGSSLVEVSDGVFSQDVDKFNSPLLLASGETVIGEYFYVEGSVQLYKILSVVDDLYTFSSAYRGTGTNISSTYRIYVTNYRYKISLLETASDTER